ncbi:hypothetical protein LCGC14_1797050 [marine sediment metagenome]|uniref:DNA methylase N-4/N-6 domain-containing protein n=1 Tax=marine sediment metagenome TaxID=412755 RepID=A0A0F9J5I9_9ZZZZ
MSQGALFAQDNQIVLSDYIAYLIHLPPQSVDLIVTDPPYASLEKHKAVGTTTRLDSHWFPIIPNEAYPRFFQLMWTLLKPNSHFYMFCDDETSDIAVRDGKAAGFTYWKRIVWDKARMGMGYHYRNSYEFILFFEKGKRNLNSRGIRDVLSFKRIQRKHDHPDFYPTEKPVELLELLVTQSSQPGELVLDPFLGSGSTVVAAKQLGRRYWGCDIQERSIELTTRRLAECTTQI